MHGCYSVILRAAGPHTSCKSSHTQMVSLSPSLPALVGPGVRILMINFNLSRLPRPLRCLWSTSTPHVLSFIRFIRSAVSIMPTKTDPLDAVSTPQLILTIRISFPCSYTDLENSIGCGARRTAVKTDTVRCLPSRSRPGFDSPYPNYISVRSCFFPLIPSLSLSRIKLILSLDYLGLECWKGW